MISDINAEVQDGSEKHNAATESPQMMWFYSKDERFDIPVCPKCLSRFALSEDENAVIQKCIYMYGVAEAHCAFAWQEYSCMCDGNDTVYAQLLISLAKSTEKAEGLYSFPLHGLPDVVAALLISLAASALTADERLHAMRLVERIRDFAAHLKSRRHLSGGDERLSGIIEDTIHPPFEGEMTLLRACLLPAPVDKADPFAWNAELQEWRAASFEQRRGKPLEQHQERQHREAVLWQAASIILESVGRKTKDWLRTEREPDGRGDFFDMCRAIHEHMFALDELIQLGCLSASNEHAIARISSAMAPIRHLVDWDECEALRSIVGV